MTYRTMLVLVDATPQSDARLGVAVSLAAAHGARLTGLHVMPSLALPRVDRPEQFVPALEADRNLRRKAALTAESMFRAATAGLKNAVWEVEDSDARIDIETRICRRARCADLTVVGQVAPGAVIERAPGRLTERLVLEAGRPVLVVPSAGRFPEVGKRVAVAWNQSREATRALGDAMPILRRAEQVWLLTIDETGGPGMDAGDRRAANGVDYLAQHGVAAKPLHDVAGDLSAGDIILSRLSDHSADLLVLGAYGHSRMRELMLGGVTRDLLQHMTVPVLMSH